MDFISGSHKMVLLPVTTVLVGARGMRTEREREKGRENSTVWKRERPRGEEWRGRKVVERERKRRKQRQRCAGWQADGCAVYWFIRRFSHHVPSSHQTSRCSSLYSSRSELNHPGLIYSPSTMIRRVR